MNAHPAGSAAVLPTAWKLLRLRWRINWNTFRRTRLVSRIFTIIGLLMLAALAGFIFWVSWQLVDFIHSPELLAVAGNIDPFIKVFPVLILTGFFVGILLTSFGVLLQALYLSRDMDFLLAAPVPLRAVFIAKLLQAILPNFGLSALFGLPILYGLGAAGGYNLLYFILVPIMMVALSLAAAGGAGVLVMLVVRVFPARRVAEVLGFLTAIFSIICSQSGNMMNANSDNVDITSQQVSSLLALVERFNTPWFPLNWPGRGLVALGENAWLPGIGLTLLSLGLAAALFWVSLQTAEHWYYTGWASVQVVAHKKGARDRGGGDHGGGRRFLDHALGAGGGPQEASHGGQPAFGNTCAFEQLARPGTALSNRPGVCHHLEGFPDDAPRPAPPLAAHHPADLWRDLRLHVPEQRRAGPRGSRRGP